MKLYENAWPNIYEEIKTWYPVWYREVLEMDALWRIWGMHLDAAQMGIIQAVDNNFIKYADAQTITGFENFLGIVYDGPRTLSERRNVLKALFTGTGHIGQREIKELISVMADGEIEVSLVEGSIQITVTRESSDGFNLYDFHLILDKIIPAHLGLRFIDNTHRAYSQPIYINVGAMEEGEIRIGAASQGRAYTQTKYISVAAMEQGDMRIGG